MSRDPAGWGKYDHPEWGAMKLGQGKYEQQQAQAQQTGDGAAEGQAGEEKPAGEEEVVDAEFSEVDENENKG